MNWVDLSIIAILVFFLIIGYGRSLFFEIVDLTGFLLAFFISLRFYNLAAMQLENLISIPHSFANVLGFLSIWYLVESFLFILIRIISKNYHLYKDFSGEKFISTIPSLLRGLVITSMILVLVGTFPIQPKIKKDVQDSRLGSLILNKTYQLEAPLKNVFGGLADDTLTFMTIKPESQESVNLGFKTEDFDYEENLEDMMLAKVNQEREKEGLPALTIDPRLTEVARRHGGDMFLRGYFSHYSPEGEDVADRIMWRDIEFMVVGENLAFAPTLDLAHQGLMNSPGHRANILSEDYNVIGIGAAKSEDYGIMFVQVFKD